MTHLRLVFLISCKIIGKQMVVYHIELPVLRCSSGTIATFPVFSKKQAIICWIWLILKHPYGRLLFTIGLKCVNPRFITCHDVIDVFRSTAIVFLDHLFGPINTNLFLSDWQIVWNPTQSNFFGSQMFMQYWTFAGPTYV